MLTFLIVFTLGAFAAHVLLNPERRKKFIESLDLGSIKGSKDKDADRGN